MLALNTVEAAMVLETIFNGPYSRVVQDSIETVDSTANSVG